MSICTTHRSLPKFPRIWAIAQREKPNRSLGQWTPGLLSDLGFSWEFDSLPVPPWLGLDSTISRAFSSPAVLRFYHYNYVLALKYIFQSKDCHAVIVAYPTPIAKDNGHQKGNPLSTWQHYPYLTWGGCLSGGGGFQCAGESLLPNSLTQPAPLVLQRETNPFRLLLATAKQSCKIENTPNPQQLVKTSACFGISKNIIKWSSSIVKAKQNSFRDICS